MRRTSIFSLALALAVPVAACKREQPAPAAAIAARVRIAPVAAEHPWVIAFLTEVSIQRPPGADARLEGRTEGGHYVPEPVFVADTRAALADFLAGYERTHARPPELEPVWEKHEPAGREPSWQLHFIDVEAGLELDGEASATLVNGAVQIELGAAQRERLAVMTRARIGRRVAVAIDDEVLMLPIVRSEITGGRLELWTGPGVDPEVAAPALLERLKAGK